VINFLRARAAGVPAGQISPEVSTTAAPEVPDFAFEAGGALQTLKQALETGPVLLMELHHLTKHSSAKSRVYFVTYPSVPLLARHAREAFHFVSDREPGLCWIAKQRHRGIEPASVIQRSAHYQSHAREAFSFDHHHWAATGAEFAVQLASAIASIREGLELTLHGKVLVWHRHDLYECRPRLFLAVPALADRGYSGITWRRVPNIPAKTSSVHVGHQ
jgi:hypothetical protein